MCKAHGTSVMPARHHRGCENHRLCMTYLAPTPDLEGYRTRLPEAFGNTMSRGLLLWHLAPPPLQYGGPDTSSVTQVARWPQTKSIK